MLKDSLVHFTKYNVWANTKVFECIANAGEEKADMIQTSSFPSIRKTLYHVWDAETIWINRLTGKSLRDWPSKNFGGSLQEAGKLFLKNSKDFAGYTEGKDEVDFNTPVAYKNLEGKEFSSRVGEIVMHCMNHSTYHRGQIITMLRHAGFVTLSSTDYIAFCRL